MGWNQKRPNVRTNIVSLRMDAAFFFERAVQSLDRFHYEKALKYFRKAVELDPKSPINHCNLAGVLSELGCYEESNNVLRSIIDEIDPSMTECYFYMANNYANMEQYELAEQSLIDYLERDEDRHFMEECEEMMEWLSYELNRPVDMERLRNHNENDEHQQARRMLEQGNFTEAAELLEQLVTKQPDFLAAHNNLALAYYCLGDMESCKQAALQVLEKDPGNLHALCNLAIYYLQKNDTASLQSLIQLLNRLYPYHPEHIFKLAMTFAVIGEHEAAYKRFKKLIRLKETIREACLFHYTAVAACYIGKWQEARRLWEQAARLDPDSNIPPFYLSRLKEMQLKTEFQKWELSYHYHLPFEDHFRRLFDTNMDVLEVVRNDPMVRTSFFWALHHGDDKVKQQVIRALTLIGGQEVETVLREYLMKSGENEYLKNLAIYALKTMGAEEPLKAIINGKEIAVYSLPLNARLPEWKPRWQEVMDLALEKMEQRGYDIIQRHDLQTLWVEYLSRVYPETPKIYKKEGWAAALEYLTAKMHRQTVSYRDLANRYNVSEATIRKNVKQVDRACGLQEKMEAIFPTFHNKL